jgi:hypothetical protein
LTVDLLCQVPFSAGHPLDQAVYLSLHPVDAILDPLQVGSAGFVEELHGSQQDGRGDVGA